MPKKSLEDRVSAIEAQLAGKTLGQHFREQAELIDRRLDESLRTQAELIDGLFALRFDEFDKKWDVKLNGKLAQLDKSVQAGLTKLEEKFDSKLDPIQNDLTAVKDAVKIILSRVR
jgi:hypothetical protein